MAIKQIQRLQQVARNMSRTEGMTKLAISVMFVPLPILAGGIIGFWLDYSRLHTMPLLVITGTLLGTLTSFLGVYGIIVFGHKGGI
ncbi:MAG: AtpZ/AtpI family protein [Dehalococcoidales bacterium]|nr:AtpZ/AtpI family protein [Dehalococcoidales bacterium]